MTPGELELNQQDRLILNAIQRDFPVESHPWATVARRVDPSGRLTEEKLLERVKILRREGFIRRLGAVFNAAPLGYYSTLCAASVPEAQLEKLVALVNSAHQVTHNYLRSGELNVWFTFTGQSPEELAEFLAVLKKEGGVEKIQEFKAGRCFKIRLDFNLVEKNMAP